MATPETNGGEESNVVATNASQQGGRRTSSKRPRPRPAITIPEQAGPDIRKLLSMMSQGDMKKEVERLSLIDPEDELDWTRENNIARLRLMQLELGLDGANPISVQQAPDAMCPTKPSEEDAYVPSEDEDYTTTTHTTTTRRSNRCPSVPSDFSNKSQPSDAAKSPVLNE